jgi:hypothetical protein
MTGFIEGNVHPSLARPYRTGFPSFPRGDSRCTVRLLQPPVPVGSGQELSARYRSLFLFFLLIQTASGLQNIVCIGIFYLYGALLGSVVMGVVGAGFLIVACYVIVPVLAGTGHGVGAALNVHEGPQRISPLLTCHQGLLPGMVVSNEPGYYEEGNFGIRIENLLEVVERPDLGTFAGKAFLGFRRLTKVPFQLKLIDTNMLTQKEKSWINEYHAEVQRELDPQLRTERARSWLAQSTEPIP